MVDSLSQNKYMSWDELTGDLNVRDLPLSFLLSVLSPSQSLICFSVLNYRTAAPTVVVGLIEEHGAKWKEMDKNQ